MFSQTADSCSSNLEANVEVWALGAFFILFSVVSVGGCEEEEATKAPPLPASEGWQYCRAGLVGGKVAGENKHSQVVLELPCSRVTSWIKEREGM